MRALVDRFLQEDADASIIVLGDLNDFWFSPPLATLTESPTPGHELVDLMTMLDADERSGFVFEGNSQDLDHILISQNLVDAVVPESVDIVRVNAEFADHASDHAPQVARFLLPAP